MLWLRGRAALAQLESVKETRGQSATLVLFLLLENTFVRVVSSLSLALIVLSLFFSTGCFLRPAAGLFWLRFVLVSDRFVRG